MTSPDEDTVTSLAPGSCYLAVWSGTNVGIVDIIFENEMSVFIR